jgi:hypothetical protein
MIKKVEINEEYCLKFSDEELEKLGLREGQKLSFSFKEDGSILVEPFSEIEINLCDFSRESLEFLVKCSVEQDLSVNDIINNILEEKIKNCYGNV